MTQADVVTLQTVHDNTLYEDASDSANGIGNGIFAGAIRDNASKRRGLIVFDVSTLPAGATVNSAAVSLYISRTAPGGSPGVVALHRTLAQWGEGASVGSGAGGPAQPGDATWNARIFPDLLWTTPGGDFAPAPSSVTTPGAPNTFAVWSGPALTADVQGWLTNSAANYGWIIIGDESVARTAVRYDSRESPTPAHRPTLTIDFTPAPPATGACCQGAICSIREQASCSGLNVRFVGLGVPCNITGNLGVPCCVADFNQNGQATVADIFAFLVSWFSADPLSDVDAVGPGAVQNIFRFLTAWFA